VAPVVRPAGTRPLAAIVLQPVVLPTVDWLHDPTVRTCSCSDGANPVFFDPAAAELEG